MTDIASLQFSIDSSQVVTSMDALTKLQERAASVADSQRRLHQESDNASGAMGRFRTSAGGVASSLNEMSAAFQGVVPAAERAINAFESLNARLEAAQKFISSFGDGTDRYLRVLREAESMGRVFGQTTEGLINYINRVNDLRLAADTTASSLNRITAALENQTSAGAAVRAVLQQYGVEIEKYRLNQTGDVLNDFIKRTRGFADTPAKTRDIQMVMGAMSVDDLNTVMSPSYKPLAQRAAEERARDANLYITRTMSDVDFRRAQREREDKEFADLYEKYDIDARGTRSETLAEMRRIEGLASQGRDYYLTPADQRTDSRRYMSRAAGEMQDFYDSPLGNWYRYINSGQFGANQAMINEQRERASTENGQPLYRGLLGPTLGSLYGFASSLLPYATDTFNNFTGSYTTPARADQRPEDPYAQARRDMTLGSSMASYGEVSFLGGASSRYRLLRMEQENARGSFRQAYGEEDGDRRYNNLRSLVETSGRYALTPEARTEDQTQMMDFLSGQRPEAQGFARYVIEQARQFNVPTSGMGRFGSVEEFLDRGGFSAGQRMAIQSGFEQQNVDRARQQDVSLEQTVQLQTRLREAVSQGAGAVEQARVGWMAYNAEFQKSGSTARADAAEQKALAELYQRNLTLTEQMVVNIEKETNAIERRTAATSSARSALDRQAAGLSADIENQAEAAERQRAGEGGRVRTALQGRLSRQAAASGDEIVGATREQLRIETELNATIGLRGEAMAKVRRDMQVDQEFQKAFAEAIAARDTDRLRALQQQAALVKQMRDDMSVMSQFRVSLETVSAAAATGRQGAMDAAYIQSLPRSDRARASAVSGAVASASDALIAPNRLAIDARFAGLPPLIQQLIRNEAENLPPEDRQAFMRMFARESSGAPQALTNPSQITRPAYLDVIAELRGREAPEAGLSLQDVQTNPIYSIQFAAEYWRLNRRTMSSAEAAAAYGPDGRRNLAEFRRTGDTSLLTREQLLRMIDAGYAPNPSDLSRLGIGNDIAGQAAGRAPGPINDAGLAYDAQQRVGYQQSMEEYNDRVGVRGAMLTLARRGETFRSQMLMADVNVGTARLSGDGRRLAGAEQARDDLQFGARVDYQARLGQIERETEQQGLLSDAYRQSSEKVQEVTVAYQALEEARRRGLNSTDAEILQQKMLKEARERTLAQVSADAKAARDQGELYQADANIPLWAGPQMRGRMRAEARVEQTIRDRGLNPLDTEAVDLRKSTEFMEQQRAIAEDQDRIRQGFLQMGQAAQSAFADAVLGGKNLQQVLGGLMNDWARLALQMASRSMFNSVADVLGSGLNLLFGGKEAVPLVPGSLPGLGPVGVAAGGVFLDGQVVRQLAAGDIVDRPSMYGLAGGRKALLGEAGRPEGVLPLARLSNGDLGVQVAGGGGSGGRAVQVTNNITIQGGAAGKGGMDAQSQRDLERQIETSVRAGVMRVLADEKRQGGMLYGS